MRMEDSVFLTYIKDEINRRVVADGAMTSKDLDNAVVECLINPKPIWPQWHRWVKGKTAKHLRRRAVSARKTKRHLQKRYARAFLTFDAALAAAEFVNQSLFDALYGSDIFHEKTNLLGVEDIVGGRLAKYLLLIGMHARMVSIATEISYLLQAGFPEGAAARSRTLYELTVKALLIASDDSPTKIELSERYCVSAIFERVGVNNIAQLDQERQEVLTRARRLWGEVFFKGNNNWALPVMGSDFSKARVTFKDLEDALNMDDMRHLYLECNDAVHAGAARIIDNSDFRRAYPFLTQADVNLRSTGRIGQASVFYLDLGTYVIARCLTGELEEWDHMLHIADFLANIKLANRLFYEGYAHVEANVQLW